MDSQKLGVKEFYIPKRYIFTVLGLWGMFNTYAMRTNLSVTIVAMVKKIPEAPSNVTLSGSECPNLVSNRDKSESEKPISTQYVWDAHTQGLILGAFYCGYVLTQLPIDFLSKKVGAKWLVGGAVLNSAIFNLLTPLIASWSATALIITRIIQGLGEGLFCPAINLMISHWSPVMERSQISSIIFAGRHFGIAFSMAVSGWLSSSVLFGGWPSVFYVLGSISCTWFVFWVILVHENPATHPTISQEELNCFPTGTNEKPEVPWRAILSSVPVWSVIVAHIAFDLGFVTFLSDLPTYLGLILHFNIKENGFLSALPFLLQAITTYIVSYFADSLRRSNRLSITNIRKLFTVIGFIGPALCLLAISISGCRPYLIIFLFALGMIFSGFECSGFNVTHVDMSPAFAGTLYAITNTIASIFGFIGPVIVGALTNAGETIANWNHVFYIISGIYVFSSVFFSIFASAELQLWGTGIHKAPTDKNNKSGKEESYNVD